MYPTGSYFPARATGAYFPYQTRGLGEDELTPVITAAALTWLALRIGGGIVAGRAMAPKKNDRMTWGVVGGLLGALGGPVALGLLGIVSLEARD